MIVWLCGLQAFIYWGLMPTVSAVELIGGADDVRYFAEKNNRSNEGNIRRTMHSEDILYFV
jgi:hypothetical protein